MDRCQFEVKEVEFLGHLIAEAGAVPLIKHMQAIRDLQRPVDSEQLQRFLGLVSLYRADYSGCCRDPQAAIKWGLLEWTLTMVPAVEAAKGAVCSTTHLVARIPLQKLTW